MEFSDLVRLLRDSGLVDDRWYAATYPDAAASGLSAAEHYLRYGAAIGRDPGPGFDTRFYLDTCPGAAVSGLNPLAHYLLQGRDRGQPPRPHPVPPERLVGGVRTRLLTLGFTGEPLAELKALTRHPDPEVRALAARDLALWHMRARSPEGYRRALGHIARARDAAPDLALRHGLAVSELLCHFFLGDARGGKAAYERIARAGEVSPDVMLAWINFQTDPGLRLAWINRMLARYAIPPLRLLPDDGRPAYDRLTSEGYLEPVLDGPKVTVLIAAYEAGDMLGTALRSLQEQTWKNLEILVLDDCSPSPATSEVAGRFAALDPRIRVIRMEVNGGAYVARNRGLEAATGEYVTLHDADDWSHPLKIETQLRFMTTNPRVIGSTTRQARASSELGFTRWTGEGYFIITNTSSFMFRRGPVMAELGGWDTVRLSGDNELIRRVRKRFGQGAVIDLQTGPLSFQRDSDSSIVADAVLGINGFLFGARKIYAEAQEFHRRRAASLRYDRNPGSRPFPAPALMRSDRAEFIPRHSHIPVVLASDFRMTGGSVLSCVEEMRFHHRRNIPLGLVEMYRYDLFRSHEQTAPLDSVQAQIDGETVRMLAYGETVTCDTLVLRYPPILQHPQRYLPKISARRIKVIVNQPPMSDYGPEGVRRYDLERCARNIRDQFGGDAEWHPIGPLVRQALLERHGEELRHIRLSDRDWFNIIDVDGWARPDRTPDPGRPLRIGRHSRDHAHKWPDRAGDIRAAYPEAGDIEIRILGGAETPRRVLGGLPGNWSVTGFGAQEPRDFLAGLDVFVYFANPGWVESFGRTIIEAMAVGVPAILPDIYRPLFGEAALYATPETAAALARELCGDPVRYDRQVRLARDHVRERFGYDMHAERILPS